MSMMLILMPHIKTGTHLPRQRDTRIESKLTRFGACGLCHWAKWWTRRSKMWMVLLAMFIRARTQLDDELFASNLTYVDPDFFELFSFNFISGSSSGLKDKTSVFISEDMAIRLFHTPQEATGKTIKQVYGTELKEVKIAGVFAEPPMNSSFYGKADLRL